jgi:thiamine-phosphate pyrophosphorylase
VLPERLCVITDRGAAGGDVIGQVARALAGVPAGAALVQLREKGASGRAQVELARALVGLGRARVLVNDRVDVALAAGAHGVHLPENGLTVAEARALLPPGAVVGASVHDVDGARARARAGADLLVLGPVWDTPGKPACGVGRLAEVARAVAGSGVTLFAVGGIDSAARVRAARDAGADGVAAIRALLAASDPGAAAAALWGACL